MSLNLIKKIHSTLLNSVRGQHKRRGEFRKEQNWIGPPGSPIDEAQYVPPEPRQVDELMSNLEEYIHSDEKDPIVQLAINHAQFEIVHPFLDGNGRVGRILVPLSLYEKKVLHEPMFYISHYFEKHQEEYYKGLRSISKSGDWENWVSFFLEAVDDQSASNRAKVEAVLNLYKTMKEKIPEIIQSQYSIQVLDAIFEKPVFQRSDFISRTKIPKSSAERIIKQMLDSGLLTIRRQSMGRKPAVVQFDKLLKTISQQTL